MIKLLGVILLAQLSLSAIADDTKKIGSCDIVETNTVADIEYWEAAEGNTLAVDINDRLHQGYFIFDEPELKLKNTKKLFSAKLTRPIFGIGFNSGAIKIDKKSGKGKFQYTERCWDWKSCGTTKYSFTLNNCKFN